MRQLPLGVRLADHATLGTFFGGPNEAAVARVRAFAEGALAVDAKLLMLVGPPASGKSHLLQGACAHCSAEDQRRCGYLSARELEPLQLARALEGWETLSLVAIDEADWCFGSDEREVLLMRLFNSLVTGGGRLLLAARQPLAQQALRLEDLRSRLAAGAQVGLAPLDDEQAGAALRLRAQARGLELPVDTATWLLRRTRRDMHSLCALLDGLDEASLIAQRRLTIPFVRAMLQAQQGGER